MTTAALSSHPKYRPDIDGLRAVAVLSVIVFHAFPNLLAGGFVGVDIFFVISGFLISSIIFEGLEQGHFSFADFYARRVRRIFPALFLVLVATLVFGWYALLPDEFSQLGKHVVAGAGFVSNLVLRAEADYFDTAAELKPLLHLWSLGIEEQFYIVWPVLVVLAYKRRVNLCLLIVAMVAISFAANLWLVGEQPTSTFYLPFTRFWELLLGSVLAYLAVFKDAIPTLSGFQKVGLAGREGRADVRSVVGLLLVLAALIALDKSHPYPGWDALLPTLGVLLILSAGPDAWVNRKILAHPALVFMGLISYPLYLWHWPLLAMLRIVEPLPPSAMVRVLVVASSILLAWLTFRLIEKPVRAKGNRTAVGLFLAVMLVGFFGYQSMKAGVLPRSSTSGVDRVVKAAGEWTYPGATLTPIRFQGRRFYRQGYATEKTLYFGDSNMEQYWSRIDRLISDHPGETKSAVFATKGGCPPIPNVFEDTHPECVGFVDSVLDFAKDPTISSVVVSAEWFGYFSGSGYYYEKAGFRDGLKLDSTGASHAYGALEDMFATLRARGKRVYVVLSIPISSKLDPRHMIQRDIFSGGFRIVADGIDRAGFVAKTAPVTARVREVAIRSGASVIDPVAYLCAEAKCPAVIDGGEPIYKDGNHLRPSFVREKVTFLDRTILKP